MRVFNDIGRGLAIRLDRLSLGWLRQLGKTDLPSASDVVVLRLLIAACLVCLAVLTTLSGMLLGPHGLAVLTERGTLSRIGDVGVLLLLFFIVCFALPVGIPLALLAGANVGWLFALTAVGYFLNYEWLHFSYHTPEGSWMARLPGVAALRRHHLRHHDQALMSRYNFNITYPIADRLFGTLYRADAAAPQRHAPETPPRHSA